MQVGRQLLVSCARWQFYFRTLFLQTLSSLPWCRRPTVRRLRLPGSPKHPGRLERDCQDPARDHPKVLATYFAGIANYQLLCWSRISVRCDTPASLVSPLSDLESVLPWIFSHAYLPGYHEQDSARATGSRKETSHIDILRIPSHAIRRTASLLSDPVPTIQQRGITLWLSRCQTCRSSVNAPGSDGTHWSVLSRSRDITGNDTPRPA